jgi:hypothetical protein
MPSPKFKNKYGDRLVESLKMRGPPGIETSGFNTQPEQAQRMPYLCIVSFGSLYTLMNKYAPDIL